jgi:hypothetical protein
MSKKPWWKGRYPFERWNKCPTRPDPVEVIFFSLDRQGIEPERYVDNYIQCGKDMLYLRKAMALSIPKMKGATKSETVDETLQQARGATNPQLTRRLTLIDIFQAQAHIDAGEYEQATKVALTALEKCKQIRWCLNVPLSKLFFGLVAPERVRSTTMDTSCPHSIPFHPGWRASGSWVTLLK